MNKIYKLKFDKRRNELVVVSEITVGMGKEKSTGHLADLTALSPFRKLLGTLTPLAFLTGLIISLFPGVSLAAGLPTGGQVVGGQGSISTSGNQMTIYQQTQNMATNWQSFNIGKNNTVQFVQPDSSSVALNRVTGTSGSQIMGTLKANGQVFILNPNGVLFGKDARVNVAGLVASTKNINTADFMKGQYTLSGESNPGAQVVNQGNLTTTKGGYIVLAGERVSNSGSVTTPSGKAVLASGKTVTLQLDNGGLTSVSVDGSVVNALVENHGLISATDGRVYLTAKGQDMLLNTVVNNSGTIEAKGLESRGGEIVLNGGDGGVVSQSGQLLADSHTGQGGKITLEGQNIHLAANSLTSATGKTGGGEVYVGGGWQGKDSRIKNASKVVMDKTATVDVSATDTGNGGTAVLWSDDYTNFRGTILARGGTWSGNGGRVETSSHDNLQAFGTVDASAQAGHGGDWLLDPTDVTIVSADTGTTDNTNITETGKGTAFVLDTDTDHIFFPSASGAQILNTSIENQLNNGTNVTVRTSGTDTEGESGNITVNANITKSVGSGTTSLTLLADNNILTANNTSIGAESGKLNLNLLAGNITNNASISLGRNINISLNGGDFLAAAGNEDNDISLTYKNNGKIDAGNVTLNVSRGLSGYAYSVIAVNDLTINGPVSGSTGWNVALNFSAGGMLAMNSPGGISLSSTDTSNGGGKVVISGNKGVRLDTATGDILLKASGENNSVTLSSTAGAVSVTAQGGDITLGAGNISAANNITLNAAAGAVSIGATNLTSVNGSIDMSGAATGSGSGIAITGTSSAKANISAMNGTVSLSGTSVSGSGLKLDNVVLNATNAAFTGSSSNSGTGFSLTNTTLQGNLADLTNVSLSSAGSGASVTNILDNTVVNTTNRNTLLNMSIENMTQIDMNGNAVFNGTGAWEKDYGKTDNPYSGWIFNNTTINASSVNVAGVGFMNSTLNVTSGGLDIHNNGSVILTNNSVSVMNGSVNLSSANGSIALDSGNISASGNISINGNASVSVSKAHLNSTNINIRTPNGSVSITGVPNNRAVLNATGNISIDGDNSASGAGYAVILNQANLTSSGLVNITGYNSGSGATGGVSLTNADINGSSITVNGTTTSTANALSGVMNNGSVNLTAVHNISVNANRNSETPMASYDYYHYAAMNWNGNNSLYAEQINLNGTDGKGAGVMFGDYSTWVSKGGSQVNVSFNGNVTINAKGYKYGIFLANKHLYTSTPSSLSFTNGTINMNSKGWDGIYTLNAKSARTNFVYELNNASLNINTTSTWGGFSKDNLDLKITGDGNVSITGNSSNSYTGIDTTHLNLDSLNGSVALNGTSVNGIGVLLAPNKDYSNITITGSSKTGNAVVIQNNVTISDGQINGTSGGSAGTGVVVNGNTHNFTNISIIGQAAGSGHGVATNSISGNNITICGTATGSGNGVQVNNASLSNISI
ncbi:filamentous hemagglutinin N-terminal domain-containing protein, partial [Salmonella enterica]|nr:filamentous hemagglutinin N-terminal domain-containing protein [Salmonella enterica]